MNRKKITTKHILIMIIVLIMIIIAIFSFTLKEDKQLINKSDEMSEQDYIDKGLCPVCHEPLVATGGCYSCGNCSFSRCE